MDYTRHLTGKAIHPPINWLPPTTQKDPICTTLTAIGEEISPLVPQDAAFFRTVFQREETSYSNSWLYLLRSTRDKQGEMGYKFVGRETVIGVGCRNNAIYLVHPMGSGRFHTTLDLCLTLAHTFQCPIILKKVDQRLYTYLQANPLFQTGLEDISFLEEEAFSEHILSLEQLYHPRTGIYQQSIPFMRKVRRFEKSEKKLTAQPALNNIEQNPGFQDLFKSHPEKYKSYKQMIQAVQRDEKGNHHYKTCVFYDEQSIVQGLYIGERLGRESMGLYCAVSSRSMPGITEWMDYHFFQQVYADGIPYLYLGGSETIGVDTYIQKLFPVVPTYQMRPLKIH